MSKGKTVLHSMSKNVLKVQLEDSVSKAFDIMKENRIRHLPVTDLVGKVIGIVSDRDLYRAMTPHPQTSLDEAPIEFDSDLKVKEYMSWPVQTVDEGERIETVAKRFIDEKISAVLVVSENEKIKGILTTEDLLVLLLNTLNESASPKKLTASSSLNQYWDHVDLE